MQVAEAYGCNLVEGVLSHQLKQFIIDANKCVLNKPSPEQKVRPSAPLPPLHQNALLCPGTICVR